MRICIRLALLVRRLRIVTPRSVGRKTRRAEDVAALSPDRAGFEPRRGRN